MTLEGSSPPQKAKQVLKYLLALLSMLAKLCPWIVHGRSKTRQGNASARQRQGETKDKARQKTKDNASARRGKTRQGEAMPRRGKDNASAKDKDKARQRQGQAEVKARQDKASQCLGNASASVGIRRRGKAVGVFIGQAEAPSSMDMARRLHGSAQDNRDRTD